MTPKVERLVNLTIALLETRRPLTFGEIRRRTGYYDQADHESARRMFERDKDDLRRLGVPVVTREDPFGDDVGYQIRRSDYELADVDLAADEVAALALAVRLTGGEGTRMTLSRLAARAPDPVAEPGAPPVRIAVSVERAEVLADAIVEHRTVSFAYRNARGETGERCVDPYAVVQRHGAWYLVGRDHDRDALRSFRLDRMRSEVRGLGDGGAFTPPETLDTAAAVGGPDGDTVRLELAVDPTARWAVESRGGHDTGATHGERPVLALEGFDVERDLPWLLGLIPEVTVVRPPAIVDAVLSALQRVVQAQGSSS